MLDYWDLGLSTTTHWEPDPDASEVTRRRVIDIVFTPMSPAERNHRISEFYHDVDLRLREVLPPGHANWFTVGKWASRMVRFAVMGLPRWVPIAGTLAAAAERSFGHGNRWVCLDLGESITIWLQTVGAVARRDDGRHDPEEVLDAWERALDLLVGRGPAGLCKAELSTRYIIRPLSSRELAELAAGPDATPEERSDAMATAAIESSDRVEHTLVRALEAYTASLLTDDPAVQAQRIWAGSVLLGAHEQEGLNDTLGAALRSIPRLRRPRIPIDRLSWQQLRLLHPGDRDLAFEDRAVRWLTRRLFVPMGDDVVMVSRAIEGDVPEAIERVVDPRAKLASELGGDRAKQAAQEGAECWLDWNQRVGVIARLYAVYHERALDIPWNVEPAPPLPVSPAPAPPSTEPMPLLDRLRGTTDEVADRAVDESIEDRSSTELSDTVAAAVADALADGGLVDVDTLERGRRFYGSSELLMTICLGFASLPEDYCGGQGIRILAAQSRLATDPMGRLGEVGNFLGDVFKAPFWEPASNGFESIVGVRRLHATIRHLLLSGTGALPMAWPVEYEGVPIDQEQLLGTLISFVVPVLEVFDRLGIERDPADRHAFVQTWCLIGLMLGVDREAITRTVDGVTRFVDESEMRALGAEFRRRHRVRTVEGVHLLEALLEDMADRVPRNTDWMPEALLRAIGGDELADLLLMPAVSEAEVDVIRAAVSTLGSDPNAKIGERVLDWFLDGLGAGRPFLDEPAKIERRPRRGRGVNTLVGACDSRAALAAAALAPD